MRRKDRLVTDKKMLHKVIYKASVCRLGLVDGKAPYIIPLSFGFDGMHLYFHSAQEGRKNDILKANPRVCVEFEQDVQIVKGTKPCSWSTSYFTVIGEGTAELVQDSQQKIHGLNIILKQYDQDSGAYPFSEQEISTVLVYRITLDSLVGKKSGG